MRKMFRTVIFLLIAFTTVLFSSCQKIDEAKIRMGLKNTDFEYIKDNKVDKIIIQSTRDKGFKFTVTDKKTISQVYDILSTAKEEQAKTTLDSDYIFEIYEGDTVHRFNYVTGIEKEKGHGNLYSDNKVYLVSKRIDNDIIGNFWDKRKPKEFTTTYYGSLVTFFKTHYSDISKNSENIGLEMFQDVEVAKYMFSMNIEDFKDDLKEEVPKVQLIKDNKQLFDVVVSIKTYGYKSNVYKGIITVYDKKEKSETKYYINNQYENGGWTINILKDKPDSF